MGNQHNSDEFNPLDWTKIETDSNFPSIWQNNHNPRIHIEQYYVNAKNQDELNLQREFFFQRKNHPYWIAAYYFQQQKNNSVCMLEDAAHIYIQKIPIKICDLRQLSLPDLIHTYYQCLQGFKTLAQILGFFKVSRQFIGINEKGIVKVWAGSQWSRIGVILNQFTEAEMVESILQCLEKFNFVQTNQLPISINGFLHRNNKKLTFNLALDQLKNFALQFNHGIVPNRIETLHKNQTFDTFFDPLIRSQHHLFQQSKFAPNPQASNSSLFKYKKKDQNNKIKLKETKEQSSNMRKLSNTKNSKPSFNFFSCMNVQQEKKNSKLFTKQQMIRHYADYYQIDHLQEISKNKIQFQQDNTKFNSNQLHSLYPQKPRLNQRVNLRQADHLHSQYHFSAQQYSNSKRYSFQVLKKQNQVYGYYNQINNMKPQNQLHKNHNQDQKLRGKSLQMTSQRQFIHFNPKISFEHLNNKKKSQIISRMPTNLQTLKIQPSNNCMNIRESKINIYYHMGSENRKPVNSLQGNNKEPSKIECTQRLQRINI